MFALLLLVTIFGSFTIGFILIEDTLRYVYKVKAETDHQTLSFKMWFQYIKALRWRKENLWRTPMIIFANGVIVICIILWTAFLSQPLYQAIDRFFEITLGPTNKVFGDAAVVLVLSGWTWKVIIPRIYARYIKDKANRFALLFRDNEARVV